MGLILLVTDYMPYLKKPKTPTYLKIEGKTEKKGILLLPFHLKHIVLKSE